jgi:membrane-bound lytic murein transglycosylase D
MKISLSPLILGLCISISNSYGQFKIEVDSSQVDTVQNIVVPFVPQTLEINDSRDNKQFSVTTAAPETIAERLAELQKSRQMPMIYNESVQKYIDYFLFKRPSFTLEMLELKDAYFPTFEKILAKNNMPDELKYLSMLESGLNPKAISRSKAVGLWQFMSFTGKEMGLTVNNNIDERMHVEKSTEAACKYLRQLHSIFGDWDLALASYNSGPGRVKRAIRGSGRTDYWDLHTFIPPDTRAYVPQFIAINYLMNYAGDHGIKTENKKIIPESKPIHINTYFDLNVFAEMSNIDINALKLVNPHIKTDIIPENSGNFELMIPLNHFHNFENNRLAILDSASRKPIVSINTENLANNNNNDDSGVITIGKKPTSVDLNTFTTPSNPEEDFEKVIKTKLVSKQVKKHHKVRKGEFLSRVATKYGVTMNEIKKWNHMKSSKIKYGETLVIFTQETKKVKSVSLVSKNNSKMIKRESGEEEFHTVQKGDTLWNICQRYGGLSLEQIKKMNNMSDNTVKVGQKIKIKG